MDTSPKDVDRELRDKLKGKIEMVCPLSFAKRWYSASQKYTGGKNWILAKILLDFWENMGQRIDSVEEQLSVIPFILEQLANKKKGKKIIKTNDGREIECP